MIDEDLRNIIRLLESSPRTVSVRVAGAIFSAGELLDVMRQAWAYREHQRSAPRE
jgi:hypothetical protein